MGLIENSGPYNMFMLLTIVVVPAVVTKILREANLRQELKRAVAERLRSERAAVQRRENESASRLEGELVRIYHMQDTSFTTLRGLLRQGDHVCVTPKDFLPNGRTRPFGMLSRRRSLRSRHSTTDLATSMPPLAGITASLRGANIHFRHYG